MGWINKCQEWRASPSGESFAFTTIRFDVLKTAVASYDMSIFLE
jgi:hypothetical protein